MKLFVIVALLYTLVGCGTVAGAGKDLQNVADWTHDKMSGK